MPWARGQMPKLREAEKENSGSLFALRDKTNANESSVVRNSKRDTSDPVEARRRLHSARSSFRDLQMKHNRTLQELKDVKVKRMISEAIEKNEIQHLHSKLKSQTDALTQCDRDLLQKHDLIKTLKGRIGTLARKQSRPRRLSEESTILDESHFEGFSRVESPPPGQRAGIKTTPSQMSVENVVDCANSKLESLLAQGNDVLLQGIDENAQLSMLEETMMTDYNMSHLSICQEDRTVLSPAHMIPFLEKTSLDLREAEAQVQRLDSDLATYEELQVTREEEALAEKNITLARELKELKEEIQSCVEPETARSAKTATSPVPSVRTSGRSLTAPSTSSASEARSLVPPRPGVVLAQNGQLMVKVGEHVTERWVLVDGRGACPPQQHEGHSMYPRETRQIYPAQPYEMRVPMYNGQYR